MLRDYAAQAFGWSPAEWGRATLRYFASRQEAWEVEQRRLDFRAATSLMAAGVKQKDIEGVFPSLKRETSVRENMEKLEALLARGGRRRTEGG
jgi:hypothetical protein